jgi:hypothetical protein
VFEFVRAGEKWDIADPGRAGRFLAAIAAFFCANIVSLREGFELPIVLLERPSPGRAATSGFLGELGLFGSFCSSFWACASSAFIMLYVMSTHR